MRSFVSIIIMFLFVLPAMLKMEIMVSWKLNQKTIIERFCENKDKPALQCNGQCHLMKTLDKVDKDENTEIPFEGFLRTELPLFTFFWEKVCFPFLELTVSAPKLMSWQNLYSYSFQQIPFIPPRA